MRTAVVVIRDRGLQGLAGVTPAHFWVGATLAFENPDGTIGAYTDLEGPPASLTVGSTTTLTQDENASVDITGAAPDFTFNFAIPRGLTGPEGPQGAPGAAGGAGTGLTAGGTAGQLLKKVSGTDFDAAWTTGTGSDVGLGNANNTSDAGKPVSTATQTALDLKASIASLAAYAPLAGATFTGPLAAPTPTTGDNDTSVATTAFVYTDAPLATFTTFSGALASSTKTRMSNTIHLGYDVSCDLTGVTSAHTALNTAITEALTRGRSEVRIPAGALLSIGGIVSIISASGKRLRIIGAGEGSGIRNLSGYNGDWFQIGNFAGGTTSTPSKTQFVEFTDLYLIGGTGGALTGGAMIAAHNAANCTFDGVRGTGVYCFARLGVDGVTATNDTNFFDFIDCAAAGSNSPDPNGLIQLGSANSLNFRGGRRWGCNAGETIVPLFNHLSTSYNTDGLYVYDMFSADCSFALKSVNNGVANMVWQSGQVDGSNDYFFYANSLSGEGNHTWTIKGVQILAGATGSLVSGGIYWNEDTPTAAGGTNLLAIGNTFKHQRKQAVYIVEGRANIEGNTFQAVGRDGVPATRFDANAKAHVVGNRGFTLPASGAATNTPFTYGEQWNGAAPDLTVTTNTSTRRSALNSWEGGSSGAYNNTP